jgi:hypothetical protein
MRRVNKDLIVLSLLIFMAGCVGIYTPPASGPKGNIRIKSLSHYNDVKVEFCETKECDSPMLIGLLAGEGYLKTWDDSPSILEEYKNRLSHSIKVKADESSFIRMTTEKTLIRIGKKGKRKFEVQRVAGYTITKSWKDYTESTNNLKCITLVEIAPSNESNTEIIHTHDEKTEECDARINIGSLNNT